MSYVSSALIYTSRCPRRILSRHLIQVAFGEREGWLGDEDFEPSGWLGLENSHRPGRASCLRYWLPIPGQPEAGKLDWPV
jgi:hypothetical protein